MCILRIGTNVNKAGPYLSWKDLFILQLPKWTGSSKMFTSGHGFKIFSQNQRDEYKKKMVISVCNFSAFERQETLMGFSIG